MFRKIATYSASLYAVSLVSSGVSFVVTMMVARHISKESLGLFGFYLTIYAFLGTLICAGLNQTLVRSFGAKVEDRAELTRVLLGVVMLVASVAWPLSLLAHASGYAAWGWALSTLPFMVVTVLGASEFRANFSRRKEVALTLSVSGLNSLLTVALVFLSDRPDMAPILGDFLSLAIPGTLLLLLFLRRDGVMNPFRLLGRSRGETATRLFTFALPLTIAAAAFVAYTHAASLLIRAMVGLAALAEFYFALQLMHILEKPMQILARVVLAGFAQDPAIDPAAHRRLITFNVTVFPLLAAGVAFGAPVLLAIVDWAMGDAAGEPLVSKYAVSPLYVAVFAVAVPARSVEFLVSNLAIARGKPQVNRNTHVITTSVTVPLLAGLIWTFGPWGAAAMPLVYQAVFLSLQSRQLGAEMPEIVRNTTRAAVVGTVLMALLLLGTRLPGSIWLFPVGAAAYVVGGHLLGGWDLRLLLPAPRSTEAGAARL